MTERRSLLWRLGLFAFAAAAVLSAFVSTATASPPSYLHLRIEGVINPPKARWIVGTLERAEREQDRLVVISIDTPGGLVSSMQQICGAITNSRVPVVGFVEPRSAQATSAGAFILLATDVAAMAPGTRVGAAHPVGSGEKLDDVTDKKATNSLASFARSLAERRGRPADWAESLVRESKSFTEAEALQAHGVDLIAANVDDLVHKLDGFQIQKGPALDTKGLTRVPVAMPWHWRLLDVLADPTLAALLMSLGVMGILYEFSAPGIGMGGIVGVICLVLGLLGVSVLPIALAGVVLVLVGLAAIAVEIKAQTHGMLAAGGIVALVLGAMLLVDPSDYFGAVQKIDLRLFAPLISVLVIVIVLLARAARRALSAAPRSGIEALAGRHGRVKAAFVPSGDGFSGSVWVEGARWEAVSDSAIDAGAEVQVTRVLDQPTRLEVVATKPRTSVE